MGLYSVWALLEAIQVVTARTKGRPWLGRTDVMLRERSPTSANSRGALNLRIGEDIAPIAAAGGGLGNDRSLVASLKAVPASGWSDRSPGLVRFRVRRNRCSRGRPGFCSAGCMAMKGGVAMKGGKEQAAPPEVIYTKEWGRSPKH